MNDTAQLPVKLTVAGFRIREPSRHIGNRAFIAVVPNVGHYRSGPVGTGVHTQNKFSVQAILCYHVIATEKLAGLIKSSLLGFSPGPWSILTQ